MWFQHIKQLEAMIMHTSELEQTRIKRYCQKMVYELAQPQKIRGAAAPFEPPFPTPLN